MFESVVFAYVSLLGSDSLTDLGTLEFEAVFLAIEKSAVVYATMR